MDQLCLTSLLLVLTFAGCGRGQDILPEGPVDAVLGKNVTLKTLLEPSSYLVIIWNHHDATETTNVITYTTTGFKVNAQFEGHASLDKTNGYLTLRALRREDSGDYIISMVTTTGKTLAGEIKLRVLEPVSDVAIKSDLTQAIEHDSTVVLTCSAKGSFLKFAWINGTTPIKADGKRLTVKDADLSSTLTITGVLRTDLAGPVYCTAGNSLETEKSAPFNLTVYYGPDQVAIVPRNPPQVLQAGSKFNLTCSAVSSPPATFTWYHSEKMMANAGPVLTLDQIQKLGLGKKAEEYTCSAKNEKTQRSDSSPGVTLAVMDAITGVSVKGPTAVLIAGNSTANISCQAKAGVATTTTWLKNGKPLSAGGRVTFAKDMSSVMIDALQKDDNGDYVCQLSNPVSKDQASFKLLVNYGPEEAMVTGETEVELNDVVMLTCTAASVPPANITWKFNGTLTNVKTPVYTLEKAVFKNTGTYTCEAHNAVTGKSTMYTHSLAVKAEGELNSLTDGAIAGIIIAVLAALAIAIGLVLYCRQKVPVESPY